MTRRHEWTDPHPDHGGARHSVWDGEWGADYPEGLDEYEKRASDIAFVEWLAEQIDIRQMRLDRSTSDQLDLSRRLDKAEAGRADDVSVLTVECDRLRAERDEAREYRDYIIREQAKSISRIAALEVDLENTRRASKDWAERVAELEAELAECREALEFQKNARRYQG